MKWLLTTNASISSRDLYSSFFSEWLSISNRITTGNLKFLFPIGKLDKFGLLCYCVKLTKKDFLLFYAFTMSETSYWFIPNVVQEKQFLLPSHETLKREQVRPTPYEEINLRNEGWKILPDFRQVVKGPS